MQQVKQLGAVQRKTAHFKAETRAPRQMRRMQPAAATVQIPSDAVKYVVRDGETLYGICMERYHSMAQISQICAWNGLADENHISVGQELYLPAK